MRAQQIKIRPWVFTLMYYLIYSAVVLRMVPVYWGGPGQNSVLGLFLLYVVLLSVERSLVNKIRWFFYPYVLVQLAIVCLLLLVPNSFAPRDYFFNLVLPLCGQAIWDFKGKAAQYFVVFLSLFCLIALIITYPALEGLGFGMTYIVGCLLIAVLSAATLNSIQAREETQKVLQDLQEANRKLIEYSQKVENLAAVEERNRLARELHDSVSQTIFSMTLTAQAAKMLVGEEQSKVKNLLEKIQELSQNALVEMRTLIQELRPHSIVGEGFVKALQKHVLARKEQDGLDIDLQILTRAELPRPAAETLFRVIQEALNNISKHARTKSAVIKIEDEDQKLKLTILDQGKGFEIDSVKDQRGHVGLQSMEERVKSLGGRLTIESNPGKGTRICVEDIPLQDEAINQETFLTTDPQE